MKDRIIKLNNLPKPIHIIGLIRDSHPQMTNIYLYGSCVNLFCILRAIYPQAKMWFNINHVITEIDGVFYDITGRVSNKGYQPIEEWYNKRGIKRAFSRMYKAELEIRFPHLTQKNTN